MEVFKQRLDRYLSEASLTRPDNSGTGKIGTGKIAKVEIVGIRVGTAPCSESRVSAMMFAMTYPVRPSLMPGRDALILCFFRLCTLDGVSISCGSELVSGEYYVAIGSEKYKCLPYEELLSPPGRNKNRPGVKRRIPKVGSSFSLLTEMGKVYSVSQDGISDSALNNSPTQEDNRRIYSTGAEPNFSSVKHTDGENSVFYAKPVRVRPSQRQKTNQMETKGLRHCSVFRLCCVGTAALQRDPALQR
ncbi:unnamed protein product [Ranitomeya imitator]|uniref:Doublecortin domain-containing protein n=1 Tax=Ranitomeya imitator TaxID=111125 RepID=A0ABN9MGY4_9NEOB|nr:unnamed protein product [Ranitomeya imitator]